MGIAPVARIQPQLEIQAAYRAAGREPEDIRPRTAYWVRKASSANVAPMNRRIHPTALRRREAIRVPTVA